jgi:hypothetical protein
MSNIPTQNEIEALDLMLDADDINKDFDIDKYLNLYKSVYLNPSTYGNEPYDHMKGIIKSLMVKHERIGEIRGLKKGKEEAKEDIIKRLFD